MSQIMPLPPRSAGVSDLLEAAAQLFRATLFKCLPQTMVAMLCLTVPAMYLEAKGFKFTANKWPDDPQFWWLYAAGFLANLFLLSTVLLRQRSLATGRATDLGSEMRFALRKLPLLAMCWILSVAAIMLGTFAFVLPGIYLAVCLSLMHCVVLFESNPPPQALVRCVKLAHPFWWRCCAALVIGLLVTVVCILAASAVLALIVGMTTTGVGPEVRAIETALGLGFEGTATVFFMSLSLVLYSAASSSA
ncbi:MAG TPA: hypothetical protein VMI92_06945 [Steroidobacteraceae bacterium]|nr:hypothetical protein [Steroidobacteraceae bacterium]